MGWVDTARGERARFEAPRRGLNTRARRIWATSDLLPADEGAIGQDAVALDLAGSVLCRSADPEIRFVAYACW